MTDRLSALSRDERRRLVEQLRNRRSGEAAQQQTIPRREEEGPQPLSFGQQRLWFLAQLEPESSAYNIHQGVRLRGPLCLEALARSMGEIVLRHEALRTVFDLREGEPVQVIVPPAPAGLQLADLSALPSRSAAAEALRLAAGEGRRPFDLRRGSLLRTLALQLGNEDHAILLTVHHIAADGWSLGVLIRELSALYTAVAAGQRPALPPLPIQYADFARWQRRRLTRELLAAQLAYWREKLAGAQAELALPSDRPRPAVPTGRGGTRSARLPPHLAAALAALARAEVASLFMVLLAAFDTLLHRVADADDVVVGTDVANRDLPETEGLIGLFVNVLVLRADLSGNPSFLTLLAHVRETALEAYAHRDLPFERLVEELQPERDLSRHPIFQVSFVLQNTPAGSAVLPGLILSPWAAGSGNAKFDLSVEATDTPAGLDLVLEYSKDLFDAPTIDRLAGQFAALLAGAVPHPGAPLSELSLLTAPERHQALVEWNDTAVELAGDGACFPRLFAARAASRPKAVAAICGAETLTYGELARRANRLSSRLTTAGLGPEQVVVLLAERGLDFLAAVLGVLGAGGAWLPIDPRHPVARWERVIGDSRARFALTEQRLAPDLEAALAVLPDGARPHLLVLEDLLAATEEPAWTGPEIFPESLAYAIYTSGSTGMPKGALVEHRGMLNHLEAKVADLRLTAADIVAQSASQSFDISVWQFLAVLLVGGRVHIIRDEIAHDPARLLAEVSRTGISILETVPSLLRLLIEEAETGSRHALPCLRWIIPTGEALPPELYRRWLRLYPDIPLLNAYGPTECSDDVTHHPIHTASGPAEASTSIGRPVPNLRVHVLDRGLHPLPIGVPGELFVGGTGVGRGYLHHGGKTAAAWLPDPFAANPAARLYRTGDRARLLSDGRLELLGRVDHQVKIRGYRIELGEIEAVLALHPGVRQTAVMVREDGGDRRLTAYVVGDAPTVELRAFLQSRLPQAMVPAAFVRLEALPFTSNGKVDRRALPAPEAAGAAAADAAGAPRTLVEEILAGLWSELLQVEAVGVHDNFFDLGGHSLLATQLASRARGAFGVELPLRAIFEEPTLAGQGARIEAARRAGTTGAAPPLLPVPRNGGLPLSFAQQRLWFLHRLDPTSPAYNMSFALCLKGRLDATALSWSLEQVVRRHETLRTTFILRGDLPVQIVAPVAPSAPLLSRIDLAALPYEAGNQEARRITAEEAWLPFALSRPPAVRPRLLRLASEEHVLLLTLHHISSDGWSMDILTREVVELYEARVTGRPPRLSALPVQYADFAVWQREWLTGEVLADQIGYWREQLTGAPATLDLPTDHPRPAVPAFRGGRVWRRISADLTQTIARLARAEGGTLFMAQLVAFAALLRRYSEQETVVVGTPVANRGRTEIEGLIGFFANVLALRADFRDDPSFRRLLGQVRETALGAYTHQDLPFEKLVDELQPQRDLSRAPVFQVLLVHQNAPRAATRLHDLTLHPFGEGAQVARFDLTLVCAERPGGLTCDLDYDAGLFEPATMEHLLRAFERLLAGAVAAPEAPLSELPLLDPEERRQVLAAGFGAQPAAAGDAGLHQLFEFQAARDPQAFAVISALESVSYGELNRRAAVLACRLHELGAVPESRVGICLRRCVGAVAAMLGILKAGGAYVPFDPEAPPERLAAQVTDAGVGLVLTCEELAPLFQDTPARPVLLEQAFEEGATSGVSLSPVLPAQAAYVIYTSGTTGAGKGVVATHRGAVNFARGLAEAVELGPGDRLLLFAPLSFDASVLQIFPTLASGATLVVHPNPRELSCGEILALCENRSLTVLDLPAALWRQWIEEVAGRGLRIPESLRCFLTGGESVPVARLRSWARLTGRPVSFLSSYGPTEATVTSTVFQTRNDRTDDLAWTDVPLGQALPGARVHVLDRNLQPVPPGVPGEIFLGGEGLARGYQGRPDLSADAFRPDPFAGDPGLDLGKPGGRLYRTGDLARQLPDGNLEFLGRADHQVKIRGFRLELAEVEAALRLHPGVREAVALVREDRPGDRRLVAYAVPVLAQAPPPPPELRDFLANRLPQHAVPSTIVVLAELPVLPSGKVNRAALPAPDEPGHSGEALAPRNPLERVLVDLWAGVLGVERVGVLDDFFALGGHSLLASQLAARIGQTLGIDVELRQLFESPTIAGFAAALLGEPERRQHVERNAELLVRLAEMSEDQVEAVLNAEAATFEEGIFL